MSAIEEAQTNGLKHALAGERPYMDVAAYYEEYWSEAGFHPQRNMNTGLAELLTRCIPPGSKVIRRWSEPLGLDTSKPLNWTGSQGISISVSLTE